MKILACIPVALEPKFETDYSHYEKVPCPVCKEDMWLGERGKKTIESGECKAMCMVCCIKGLCVKEDTQMEKLTDRD